MSTSNTSLALVQSSVRNLAYSDFAYLANNVLGCDVNKVVAVDVQALLGERRNAVVVFSRPRVLATAIIYWLYLHEINVLTSVVVPKSEVCEWLGITCSASTHSATCCVEILQEGVQLTWLS